jgi:excisionase family DNA binding protein
LLVSVGFALSRRYFIEICKSRGESLTEKLYTIEELAAWLKCSRDTIEKAVRDGKLEARRPGGGRFIRIPQSAVDSYVGQKENKC